MSQEIYSNLEKYNVEIYSLNDIYNLSILNNYNLIIIMCSTTGNGDFPDNSLKFWKKIKDRTLNKNLLENVNYTICGLGDSNYGMFCYAGKRLQKRFKELNGNEVIPLYLMDAVYDDEEQLQEYMNKIMNYLDSTRFY